ncbi:MAG: hypothetical protein IK139_03975 [Lachnospiraceae bacterium]|nr:hypothetical protein [Lachnospiraceae bacterium]
MDKYERKVRVNQIISLIDRDEFGEALEIADTIDWRTEKSVRTLRMVSEVYKINRRYDDAFNVLSIAYDRDPDDPIKRKIIYDLCEVAIKLDQYAYAIKYLKEFYKLSPNDPGRYILHYKILKATGADPAEMIETLEEFKKNYFGDFLEKWAYELASLYYQTGQSQQCINACDEIILWFVKGPYVEKAKELKSSFVSEADLSQGRNVNGYMQPTQDQGMYGNDPYYGESAYQTGGDPYAAAYDGQFYGGQMQDPGMQQDMQQGMQQGQPEGMSIEIRNVYASNEPTIRMPDRQLEEIASGSGQMNGAEPGPAPERDEILINVDKYSTINLQEELKANIDELEEKTGEVMTQPEQSIPEPDVGMTEIFNEKDAYAEPGVEDLERAPEVRDVPVYRQERSAETLYRTEDASKPTVIKKTEFGESLPRMPQQYRNLLKEDYDGQMNMNVPDTEPAQVEKQITGQMDLATVLEQWEEVRAESKRRFETLTPRQVSKNESERNERLTPERIRRPERPERPEKPERPERPERPESSERPGVTERKERPDRSREKENLRGQEKRTERREEAAEERITEKTDFSPEERQIFAPFISMGGMEDRLLKALSRVSMTGSKGNAVITGNEETLRMAMAQSLARDQQQKNSYMGIKVAKIEADVFNTKDIARSLKALDGNVLVVEKAARLTGETMRKLLETLSSDGLSLLVILEDDKNALRNLPWDNEVFNRVFSVAIEIPMFSNKNLVQHAKDYARGQEYLIDEMAILALYSRIDELQTADHQVTASEVEAIVDDAIKNVNKKNMSHLMDVLFAKRYNEDDLIIIREKDFEKK